jgi:hypothetical protein
VSDTPLALGFDARLCQLPAGLSVCYWELAGPYQVPYPTADSLVEEAGAGGVTTSRHPPTPGVLKHSNTGTSS